MKKTELKGTLARLHSEVLSALNQSEPHDYYERLERIMALVKRLDAVGEDTMILSQTAYNKGFADAMSEDNFNPPYSTKDERHADYSFGFQMGVKEYDS